MLDEYETLQFQGVFTDDQPGKFFKTHNITNNKKTVVPPPPQKKKNLVWVPMPCRASYFIWNTSG